MARNKITSSLLCILWTISVTATKESPASSTPVVQKPKALEDLKNSDAVHSYAWIKLPNGKVEHLHYQFIDSPFPNSQAKTAQKFVGPQSHLDSALKPSNRLPVDPTILEQFSGPFRLQGNGHQPHLPSPGSVAHHINNIETKKLTKQNITPNKIPNLHSLSNIFRNPGISNVKKAPENLGIPKDKHLLEIQKDSNLLGFNNKQEGHFPQIIFPVNHFSGLKNVNNAHFPEIVPSQGDNFIHQQTFHNQPIHNPGFLPSIHFEGNSLEQQKIENFNNGHKTANVIHQGIFNNGHIPISIAHQAALDNGPKPINVAHQGLFDNRHKPANIVHKGTFHNGHKPIHLGHQNVFNNVQKPIHRPINVAHQEAGFPGAVGAVGTIKGEEPFSFNFPPLPIDKNHFSFKLGNLAFDKLPHSNFPSGPINHNLFDVTKQKNTLPIHSSLFIEHIPNGNLNIDKKAKRVLSASKDKKEPTKQHKNNNHSIKPVPIPPQEQHLLPNPFSISQLNLHPIQHFDNDLEDKLNVKPHSNLINQLPHSQFHPHVTFEHKPIHEQFTQLLPFQGINNLPHEQQFFSPPLITHPISNKFPYQQNFFSHTPFDPSTPQSQLHHQPLAVHHSPLPPHFHTAGPEGQFFINTGFPSVQFPFQNPVLFQNHIPINHLGQGNTNTDFQHNLFKNANGLQFHNTVPQFIGHNNEVHKLNTNSFSKHPNLQNTQKGLINTKIHNAGLLHSTGDVFHGDHGSTPLLESFQKPPRSINKFEDKAKDSSEKNKKPLLAETPSLFKQTPVEHLNIAFPDVDNTKKVPTLQSEAQVRPVDLKKLKNLNLQTNSGPLSNPNNPFQPIRPFPLTQTTGHLQNNVKLNAFPPGPIPLSGGFKNDVTGITELRPVRKIKIRKRPAGSRGGMLSSLFGAERENTDSVPEGRDK